MPREVVMLRALIVCIAPAATVAQFAMTMQKHELSSVRCLDGSPAAHYIAANATSTKYVVYLEGGGMCKTLDDCKNRSTTDLGSSKNYSATRLAGSGILAGDDSNPDFASWNRIYVPYCSGDLFGGMMTEPTNPFNSTDSWRGYFSGHLHLKAVIGDLKANHGAGSATDVILSGCSAGGIGTFSNCDFFADSFPEARAACRPEAGYFGLPIAPYASWVKGETVSDSMMHHDIDLAWSRTIKTFRSDAVDACNKSTDGGHGFPFCKGIARGCCDMVPYFSQYTKTPIFISQNTMDSYQISVQGGALPWHIKYVAYVHGVIAGALTSAVINGPKRATDGMFATPCFAHCHPQWSSGKKIDGVDGAQAFGDWYFDRSKDRVSHMHLGNSSFPTCWGPDEMVVV